MNTSLSRILLALTQHCILSTRFIAAALNNLRVSPRMLHPSSWASTRRYSFNGETFASLGMTPGTYTWTWGSGTASDFFTFNIVPEPTSFTLIGLGG